MKREVFISYSRHDADVVNKFVDRLEQEGIAVWIDRKGVECGDEFKEVITQAIKDSSVVLFFSSKFSNRSEWTEKEIGMAAKYKKNIIPILLDDSRFNGNIEFDLVNCDFVDYYNSSDTKDTMERLVHSVKSKLSRSNDTETIDTERRPKRSRKTLLIDGLIVVIVALLVAAFLLLRGNREESSTVVPEVEQPEPEIIPTTVREPSRDLTITVNGISFVMKHVEGGTFQMGATVEQGTIDPWDDEKPVHNVTVSTFHMSETEVTQALWKTVMGTEPSFKGGWASQCGRGDDYPAYLVSWNDCQMFIKELNRLTGRQFRMPTEAEWEFAARGGNKSGHFKYAGDHIVGNVAWHKDNSNGQSHRVRQARPNELGLYDMSGNVWEWCSDGYADYIGSDQINPNNQPSTDYKVLRSGSWSSVAAGCRVSSRYGDSSNSHELNYGLRLVLPQ